MEKQKFRYYYGILEKQFRAAYDKAKNSPGVTGEVMLQILETRLDSVVYHLGFGNTRRSARQLVGHGHVKVNGRRVNVSSYAVRIGDEIEIKETTVSRQLASRGMESSTSRAIPDWVTRNKEAFKGSLVRVPTLAEIQPVANEQAVIEFYSR
jgi:small subunit ribosomal protein S4